MFLYPVLLTLAGPFLLLRGLRAGGLSARLGQSDHAAPGVVWIHAASNGEAMAARPLVQALLDADPVAQLLISCNTLTAQKMIQDWNLDRLTVTLAPLDFRWSTRRFLQTWKPKLLIIIENELWPNRLRLARQRGIPVVLASARLSAGSARMWARFPKLAGKVMGCISLVSAQDTESEQRLQRLGVAENAVGPRINLKLAQDIAPPDPETLADLSPAFAREKTVLAASTHDGEEEIVLAAFAKAHAKDPDLRLIIAPRHTRRAEEVASVITAAGLTYARRTAGQRPDAPVYLADTMGEMACWYTLAARSFIGGSLVARGGHTPFEPAAYDSAILHGPHLDNFKESYAALQGGQASVLVRGETELCAAFGDPSLSQQMPARARAIIDPMRKNTALNALVNRVLKLSEKAGSSP